MSNKITISTGVGLNMFFLEYTTIEIPTEDNVEVKKKTTKRKVKKDDKSIPNE